MNSRFVPITISIISLLVAVFFIVYFSGLWRWIIASPLLVFVTWPAVRIGFFAPQEEVDKMTGADKLQEPINPYLLLLEIISFSKYIVYAATAYLSFSGFQFYIVPLLTILVCIAKTFDPVRYNLARNAKRRDGLLALLKTYLYFYIQDFLKVSIVYGLGFLAYKAL